MDPLKIGIVGAAGRMGAMLVRQVHSQGDACQLIGATERAGSPALGKDAGTLAGIEPLGIFVTDDPVVLFAQADAVIDFTAPAATVAHAALAAQGKTIHVIGTTGLEAAHDAEIQKAARHTAIVRAANFSVGVNLLQALTQLQEHTVAFAVKLIAVSITLALMAGMLGSEIVNFSLKLFNDFPRMI